MQKLFLISILLISLQVKAQPGGAVNVPATLNIGGGSAEINPSFFLDWSIGESTIIETFLGENAYASSIIGLKWNVTSGILQPFDKTNIIFNSMIPQWTAQEIRVYPVPTPNTVYIDLRSYTTGKISMQLMTFGGRLIGAKTFNHVNGISTQAWDMKNQPAGMYSLKISLSSVDGKILKQGTFIFEKIQ